MRARIIAIVLVMGGFVAACSDSGPTSPSLIAMARTGVAVSSETNDADDPGDARFSLEVKLDGDGAGRVKFRQPKDEPFTVHLDTRVKDLSPNTAYRLQRAVDTTIDGGCTSSAWLTLGKGSVPQSILTDDKGDGRESLFRVLTAPAGSTFDIHFRIVEQATNRVVLTSDCHTFIVRG